MSASSNRFSEAKTIVLWDIEDCCIPDGLDPPLIQKNIKSALANVNYLGKVSIRAYGDTNLFPDIFHSLGITPIRIGEKHARVNKIINDMFIWAFEHKSEPLNIMVISGDVSDCFLEAIYYLEERNYNILLAQPQNVSEPHPLLRRSVSLIWRWTCLSAGGYPFETKAKAQVPRDIRVVDQKSSSSSERYNRSKKRRHSISLSSSEYSTSSSSQRRYHSSPSPIRYRSSSPRRYRSSLSPIRYRSSSPRRYSSSPSTSSLSPRRYCSSPSRIRYRSSSPRRYRSSPSTSSSSLRRYRSSPSPIRYHRSSPSPRR